MNIVNTNIQSFERSAPNVATAVTYLVSTNRKLQANARMASNVDLILNQTWSIRTISPFAVKLDPCEVSETGMSDYLRQHWDNNNQSGNAEKHGTYVKSRWISLLDSGEEDGGHHLHMDIHIADESSAQLLFCCASTTADATDEGKAAHDSGKKLIDKFGFVGVRGSRRVYRVIIQWWQATHGCVVGDRCFEPSSRQIAHTTLSAWNRKAVRNAESTKVEVFQVMFAPPADLEGMDKLTLSIPSGAFRTLLHNIEEARPQKKAKLFDRDEGAVIRALHCFISEAFHLKIQSFTLTEVSTSRAVLRKDGRFKVLAEGVLHQVLRDIQGMIEEQIQASSKLEELSNTTGASDSPTSTTAAVNT